MARNPFAVDLYGGSVWVNAKKGKRTLGIRDKQILYRRANGRCENPSCGKKIDFDEMESGHKNAASKGGSATLRNSVCLCARCNKLQGTDSWATFMRKQGQTKTSTVTSSKKKRASKKKASRGEYWINPITGMKGRAPQLFG